MVDTQRIDNVDFAWLKDAEMVLDIGSGDGTTNIHSIHGEWFKRLDAEGRYLGVDAQKFDKTLLTNILDETNIQDFDTPKTFDCILCLHVLEHVPFEDWGIIFEKIKKWLRPNGYLIVGVPYKQGRKDYKMQYPPPVGHVTFDITEETFEPYIGGLILRDVEIVVSNTFNGDGANIIWASLRWLKRFLTMHPYRKNGLAILLRYQKTVEEGEQVRNG